MVLQRIQGSHTDSDRRFLTLHPRPWIRWSACWGAVRTAVHVPCSEDRHLVFCTVCRWWVVQHPCFPPVSCVALKFGVLNVQV